MTPFDEASLAQHRRLVARMSTGDREAMQLLYFDLSPIMHGIARRILADPEDAREVVQDTFVKLWRHAPHYRADRGEVVAWLTFIARRIALDRVRQGSRRRQFQVDVRAEEVDAQTPTARDAIERQDFLDRQLAHLSTAQRQALELAFFEGCTQVEISTAMSIPVGNVKNHLRRGLAKLRQLLTSDHDA